MEQNQTQPSVFKQTNAYAMNYAVPYGIYWTAGMLCFVNSMDYTMLSLVFYFIFASAPVAGYMLLARFRDKVCGGTITFGRGYLFSLLTYFYAALLLAAACFAYFQFFDHGAFIDGYLRMLDSPEVKQAFEQESMRQLTNGNGLQDLKKALSEIQSVPPAAFAANILDFNIFIGLLLSIPTSLLAARRTPKM